jgi:dTDP-glucose 4,6-dehydratase
MNHILVTGGAGFIGSNFIHFMLEQYPKSNIFNLDALTYAGNLENLSTITSRENYHFIHANIRERASLEAIFNQNKIDSVIHFAAESHVDRSIANPLVFVETNVLGTANLLEVCMNYWQNLDKVMKANFRFLHVSTDEVFGSLEPDDPPFSENTPYAPNSPYAASKAASDHLVRSYYHTYRFPALITNCSNNYGPFQFPEKLIPLVILNATSGKHIPVYGDGQQIRDWLYVEDHCAALLQVLQQGMIGQTYNIGGSNQPTNLHIIQTICSILDRKISNSPFKPHQDLITFIKDRPGHDRRYAMDISKIQSELGWSPQESLQSGLEKTIDWYLSHKSWVDNISARPDFKSWITDHYSNRTGGTHS